MIKLYEGDAKRIQHFCKVHSYAKLIAETEHVDERTAIINLFFIVFMPLLFKYIILTCWEYGLIFELLQKVS